MPTAIPGRSASFSKSRSAHPALFCGNRCGCGLGLRAWVRGAVAPFNNRSGLLCRTAARRALNVRADDLRLARVVPHLPHSGTARLGPSGSAPYPRTSFFRGLVPAADVRAHGVHDNIVHALGMPGTNALGMIGTSLMLYDDLSAVFCLKRQLAGQHFVHHHAERVQVGGSRSCCPLACPRDIVH